MNLIQEIHMMSLFLLEINNDTTKQIKHYVLILTPSKLLVRIKNNVCFLVFENMVAEL